MAGEGPCASRRTVAIDPFSRSALSSGAAYLVHIHSASRSRTRSHGLSCALVRGSRAPAPHPGSRPLAQASLIARQCGRPPLKGGPDSLRGAGTRMHGCFCKILQHSFQQSSLRLLQNSLQSLRLLQHQFFSVPRLEVPGLPERYA